MPNLTSDASAEKLVGPWLGYKGAAAHTSLSGTYLRQLVMADLIPHRKVGRRVLFSVPALDAWVDQGGATESTSRETKDAA